MKSSSDNIREGWLSVCKLRGAWKKKKTMTYLRMNNSSVRGVYVCGRGGAGEDRSYHTHKKVNCHMSILIRQLDWIFKTLVHYLIVLASWLNQNDKTSWEWGHKHSCTKSYYDSSTSH